MISPATGAPQTVNAHAPETGEQMWLSIAEPCSGYTGMAYPCPFRLSGIVQPPAVQQAAQMTAPLRLNQ